MKFIRSPLRARDPPLPALQAEMEQMAKDLVEEFKKEWEPVMDNVEKAAKALDDLDGLMDGPDGFDLSSSLWKKTGWREVDDLRCDISRSNANPRFSLSHTLNISILYADHMGERFSSYFAAGSRPIYISFRVVLARGLSHLPCLIRPHDSTDPRTHRRLILTLAGRSSRTCGSCGIWSAGWAAGAARVLNDARPRRLRSAAAAPASCGPHWYLRRPGVSPGRAI